MRLAWSLVVPVWIIVLAACSSSAIPPVRFANAPPVTVVDDRRDVPKPPAKREFFRDSYHLDGNFYRRADRAMALPVPQRALGVNALDEVPDSTWFTNRIGVRDLTLDELRTASATVGSPASHKPWKVVRTKQGGKTTGLIVTDTRGEKFIIKFDRPGMAEIESAADVIVNRLLWACGYNVPEDHVVVLRPSDLVLGADAVVEVGGKERKLDRATLDAILRNVDVQRDGSLRAVASRMLDGKALGGHPAEGVRPDDPNDRIPHERRRDLRGMQTLFAWLDQNDVKEDNTVDMWVADPVAPKRHYVKHYLVDFGMALGATAVVKHDPREGYAYRYELDDALESLVTFGLKSRRWEDRRMPVVRGIGAFDSETYHPAKWKAQTPAYLPFITADRFDKFWAAKILIRFTRNQLRAAVETGQLGDPRAVDYLVDTLVDRQRMTAAHWFREVASLDGFAIEHGRLCFDDLLLHYHLTREPEQSRYLLRAHDRDGRPVGAAQELGAAPRGARTCAAPLPLSAAVDGYTVIRIDVVRGETARTMDVHLARTPAGMTEVIGIWRR